MRWLFLLLVVLNVGYVAWELGRERPQPVHAAALPTGVERIVLLRELGSGPADREELALSPIPPSAQQADIQASGDDAARLQQPEAEQIPAAPTQVAVADVEPAAVNKDAAPAGVSADADEVEPVEKTENLPAVYLCYTLGPFSEMQTLRLVTREIRDYVVEASFRSREEQEQTRFRVFIRPVGSKKDTDALIEQLVSKNIRDYFIITAGPNKNGISLGYFSNKSRAYGHADRIRKLGFDVVVEPVFRTYTIYWLDYRIKKGHEIPQQIFDDHLENSAQRLSRTCS